MGRKAKLKRQRRQQRDQEAWDDFVSPRFLLEARRMILESGASADSCICSVKVLSQIGKSIGLRVEPLVVEAYIYNEVFVQHFANKGFNVTEGDLEGIAEEGGHYVVMGSREQRDKDDVTNKWQGHLVAVVYPPRDVHAKPHVLDISVDQSHRPEKGLFLQEPVIFPIPSRKFLQGGEDAVGLTTARGAKMCMVYRAHPDVADYESSPDWQRDYEATAHTEIEFVEPSSVESA